jgi:hypothetical protein
MKSAAAAVKSAAVAVVLLLARASASSPPWTAPSDFTCWDPSTRHLCLPSWTVGGGNASFTLVCTPPPGSKLQWCGLGFNTVIPSPDRWGMGLAEIIMLVAHADGTVSLEDRQAKTPGLPPCFSQQLSTLRSYSFNAKSGALTASFTRPVFLPQELIAAGYTQLNRTVPTIAAAGWSAAQVSDVCDTTLAYHDTQFNNVSIAFM